MPTKLHRPAPRRAAWVTLKCRLNDDPAIILGDSYLCRGAGLLFAGPSGIGKSSFIMQCAILWATQLIAFGIPPRFPVKSLMVQSENDDGDLAEMRDGVLAGMDLTDEQRDTAMKNILVVTEDSRTAADFTNYTIAPLLEEHTPDLLWIDPALAYLGGETSKQKDVGYFLRNLINPLIHKAKCGCVIVHHTNKPTKGEEKSSWRAGDLAYLGSGSIEWTNWARAILCIQSIGSHTVFKLVAPNAADASIGPKKMRKPGTYSKHIA